MSYQTIEISQADGIATIRLNRPDNMNAFTVEMAAELVAALDEIDANDTTRALVLTGNGRAFLPAQHPKIRAPFIADTGFGRGHVKARNCRHIGKCLRCKGG